MLPSDMDKFRIEELPLYSFEMIVTATSNFDTRNMLGMGGFGPVYKVTIAFILARLCIHLKGVLKMVCVGREAWPTKT